MTETKTLRQKLVEVQALLKAPKDLENKFGGYKYRSAESILEAVKPLLHERGLYITITDQILNLGNRFYVEATVIVGDYIDGFVVQTKALAREAETKKGMDESQITGAASSYARKYALNGMFAIDDTKDADATNDHGKGPKENKLANQEEGQEAILDNLMGHIDNCTDHNELNEFNTQHKKAIDSLLPEWKTKLGLYFQQSPHFLAWKQEYGGKK